MSCTEGGGAPPGRRDPWSVGDGDLCDAPSPVRLLGGTARGRVDPTRLVRGAELYTESAKEIGRAAGMQAASASAFFTRDAVVVTSSTRSGSVWVFRNLHGTVARPALYTTSIYSARATGHGCGTFYTALRQSDKRLAITIEVYDVRSADGQLMYYEPSRATAHSRPIHNVQYTR